MTRNDLAEQLLPLELVRDLVARHGALRVLRAWAAATGRKRRPPAADRRLNDHMRRDIGLAPVAPARPPPEFWR